MTFRSINSCAGMLFVFISVGSIQAYVSDCDSDCQRAIKQNIAAAEQLESLQQYTAAAQQFAAAIVLEPLSTRSQYAARRAGDNMEQAGRFSEAVSFYETAISIAYARYYDIGAERVVLKRNMRDALFERAGALLHGGDKEAAALAYETAVNTVLTDLAAEPPSVNMRQDSAVNLQQSGLEAAVFLEEHGDPDRALDLYDRVIAIGDARGGTADGKNVAIILNAKRDALLRIAAVCKREGCGDLSRQAILRIQGEFPTSSQMVEARIIEANLNNWPTVEAETLVSRDKQARAILDQAFQSDNTAIRLCGADQVINNFPDTPAAIAALEKKARELANLKRFDEAQAVYTQILDGLRPTAARSNFFQTARVCLKRLLSDSIAADLHARKTPPDQRWEQLRSLCNEIIAQDIRPDEVALTKMSLMESYGWEGRFVESAAMAEQILAEQDPKSFQLPCAYAHFILAMTDQQAGRYDSGLAHLHWITEQSGLDPHSTLGKTILPVTYHRIWFGLKQSGASPEAVAQAEQELKAVEAAN